MIFFQLPGVPERILTAFGASLFRWAFQRPGLKAQDAKAYLDLYQSPSKFSSSSFFTESKATVLFIMASSHNTTHPFFCSLVPRFCQTESGLMAFRENAGRQRSAFGRFQTYLIRLKALSSLEYIYIYKKCRIFFFSRQRRPDRSDQLLPLNGRSRYDGRTGQNGQRADVAHLGSRR